jgi:hypothetical protein
MFLFVLFSEQQLLNGLAVDGSKITNDPVMHKTAHNARLQEDQGSTEFLPTHKSA